MKQQIARSRRSSVILLGGITAGLAYAALSWRRKSKGGDGDAACQPGRRPD